MDKEFKIKFWGVRGTVPVAGLEASAYGGNTSCIEVNCAGRHIIFDAGTGLFPLGRSTKSLKTDIFLSHSHLDHIQGLPFYRPLHVPHSIVALWAGHLKPDSCVKNVIEHLMRPPIFPLTLKDVQSRVEFNDFMAGENIINAGINDAGITIQTLPLNHPDRATAYRLSCYGKSVCYVTDVEHTIGKVDASLVSFLMSADVFIYDSTFDDENFTPFVGWGHSTWQQGVRIADAAKVKTFVAFHHDPYVNDAELDRRGASIIKQRPNGAGLMAREGMEIDLLK